MATITDDSAKLSDRGDVSSIPGLESDKASGAQINFSVGAPDASGQVETSREETEGGAATKETATDKKETQPEPPTTTTSKAKKRGSVGGASSGPQFPLFKVYAPPDKEGGYASVLAPPRRRTSGPNAFISNDPYRPCEMTPETTLVEFISTSAAFHGVKKQDIRQLEWDILKVFTNNVMPANAAAWYMAKRRYYLNNPWESQLLPFLLKKYPEKFYVRHQNVEFLEVCTKDVARKKMNYMVNQGLYAYFSHKADEYGVYFFDPHYYEHTEPFHANLRVATNSHTGHRSKLIPAFFGQYKESLVFNQHSPYLVTLSKATTQIKINTTGVIVNMVGGIYGIIQFPSGTGTTTEKALFCTKSLYVDAWQYKGDPLRLDAINFDGYKIPGASSPGRDYTWFAVLVWAGRKPSPKFCATKEDLTSGRFERQDQLVSPLAKSPTFKSPKNVDDSMIIGEVIEIKRNGAVVSMQSKDSKENALIPGWRFENLRKSGQFLTTTQGLRLALKDLVGFYIDPNSTMVDTFNSVAHQVMILKRSEEQMEPLNNNIQIGEEVTIASPTTRNGILRRLSSINSEIIPMMPAWKLLNTINSSRCAEDDDADGGVDSSNYESFDEAEDVSDGELVFLKDGLTDFLLNNNDKAHFQSVMNEMKKVIDTRNIGKGGDSATPSSSPYDSGHASSSQEVSPRDKKFAKRSFWRTKKAFKCLESYNSEEDPNYSPDEDLDARDSKAAGRRLKTIRERNQLTNRKLSVSSRKSQTPNSTELYWASQILIAPQIKYCPHVGKWITDPDNDWDDKDKDYSMPGEYFFDSEDSESEIPPDELKDLFEDALKDPVGIPTTDQDETDKKSKKVEIKEAEKKTDEAAAENKTDEAAAEVKTTEPEVKTTEPEVKTTEPETNEPENKTTPPEKEQQKDDTEVAGNKAVKEKKVTYKKRKYVPHWLKFLMGIKPNYYERKKSAETDNVSSDPPQEKEGESGEKKDVVDGAEDDLEYDSDFDPEYVPPPIIFETDFDYDEYSDGEIDQDEVDALLKETTLDLNEQVVGECTCSVAKKKPRSEKRLSQDKDVEKDPESKGDSETKDETKVEKTETNVEKTDANVEKQDETKEEPPKVETTKLETKEEPPKVETTKLATQEESTKTEENKSEPNEEKSSEQPTTKEDVPKTV